MSITSVCTGRDPNRDHFLSLPHRQFFLWRALPRPRVHLQPRDTRPRQRAQRALLTSRRDRRSPRSADVQTRSPAASLPLGPSRSSSQALQSTGDVIAPGLAARPMPPRLSTSRSCPHRHGPAARARLCFLPHRTGRGRPREGAWARQQLVGSSRSPAEPPYRPALALMAAIATLQQP